MSDVNNCNTSNSEFSLKDIVDNDYCFEIPRYQRLFTWEEPQLLKLLDDIYESYKQHKEKYYIGMLTSTYRSSSQNDPYVLVDGQQRITALTLIFVYIYSFSNINEHGNSWKNFLISTDSGKPRLHFMSRSKDNEVLTKLCDKEYAIPLEDFSEKLSKESFSNNASHSFIEAIKTTKKWFDCHFACMHKCQFKCKLEVSNYINYLFKNTKFFISVLPQNYNGNRLNQYFEAMNSTGLNLEQHEILKVLLIQKVEDVKLKNKWLELWNRISDMEHLCFQFKPSDEAREKYRGRLNNFLEQKNIDFENITDSLSKTKTIDLTSFNKNEINDWKNVDITKAIIPFKDLLLQVLYHILKKKNPEMAVTIESFFNSDHLLDTFNKYVLTDENPTVTPEDYLNDLYYYRVALDTFFVSELTYDSDNEPNRFKLDYFNREGIKKDKFDNDSKDLLRMYESMLYVNYSTPVTYYVWFNYVMDFVDQYFGQNTQKDSEQDLAYSLYNYLKNKDKERHSHPPQIDDMTYQKIDRYWFWRLDFELWRRRKDLFSNEKYFKVADNYVFRRNRSIEHVAPQNPANEDVVDQELYKEDKKGNRTLDHFGNLCMISSGLNSSLRNKSFSEKKGHVEAFTNVKEKKDEVSIESLKLLMIYKQFEDQNPQKTWNKGQIDEHGEAMYKILEEAFKDN